MDPVELFKQLSDTTRLRCLSLMVSEGELCVCNSRDDIRARVDALLSELKKGLPS